MSEGSEVAQDFEASHYGRPGIGQLNGDCKDSKHGGKEITPPSGTLARDLRSLEEEQSLRKGSERPLHPEGNEQCHAKASWPGESACHRLGGSKKEGTYQQPDRAGTGEAGGNGRGGESQWPGLTDPGKQHHNAEALSGGNSSH